MSVPAADGGPIQNFIRSLYSRGFYRLVPGLSAGAVVRHLLFLSAVLGLVSAVQWSALAGLFLDNWRDRVETGRLPAMRVQHGRLEVRGPQPAVLAEEIGLVIVDTTGAYTAVPDSVPAGFFVGPDGLSYKSGPNVTRIYDFRGQHFDEWLEGAVITGARRVVIPTVLVGGTVFFLLASLLVNLTLVLVLAGSAWVADRIFGRNVGYTFGGLFRLGSFAVTPVAILFEFLRLIVPRTTEKLLPFYPALTAFVLLAVIRVASSPPPSEADR